MLLTHFLMHWTHNGFDFVLCDVRILCLMVKKIIEIKMTVYNIIESYKCL